MLVVQTTFNLCGPAVHASLADPVVEPLKKLWQLLGGLAMLPGPCPQR